MSKQLVIIVIVLIVLIVGVFYLMSGMGQGPVIQQPTTTTTTTTTKTTQSDSSPVPVRHEVTYTDTGFSPSMLAVKVGDVVNFTNQSSFGMWVGSAMHPSHIVYSGTSLQEHCPDAANTSFDQCKSIPAVQSWSFKFDKPGTWGYHNHVKASDWGKVTVEQSL